MITKRDIVTIATTLGLTPHVVEKDWALGWVLAGIAAHPETRDTWVFKGGTCLKKCFFETYRFSEDLDFTLVRGVHLDKKFLDDTFQEISDWIYERSGLELPSDSRNFDIYDSPRGARNCQGKLGYRGPLASRAGGLPRIKLDLTADEKIVLTPARFSVFHPYSDSADVEFEALAYSYEEAFAEKVRALAERTRPRDLYDVVNLFRNNKARPSAPVLLNVLAQKCAFKKIPVPALEHLESHKDGLAGSWDSMLKHQLPALPEMKAYWDVLPDFFDWLRTGSSPEEPFSYVLAAGEHVVYEHTLRLPLRAAIQAHLEIIRFCAASRLYVLLTYGGKTMTIEPYSVRRTRGGDFLLHAWNVDANEHRSYRLDRIESASMTSQTFTPRYLIELTPEGPFSVK